MAVISRPSNPKDTQDPLHLLEMSRGKTLFITGTDTGAGKTVVTALLLAHLRSQGVERLGHETDLHRAAV